MIGRSGERGMSVLAARHGGDDDVFRKQLISCTYLEAIIITFNNFHVFHKKNISVLSMYYAYFNMKIL